MLRRSTAPLAAALCVFAWHAGAAQTGTSPYSTSLTVSGGLSANGHVDQKASPLAYSGLGYDASLGFRRALRGGRWSLAATLDGARRTYTPDLGEGPASRETSFDGRLAVSLVRELGASPSHGLGVGLFADASGALLRHHYADPLGTVSDYVHAVASIGPQVTWRQAIGDGLARVDVSTPLIGVVHRPYADTRSVRPSPTLRFATPADLRAVNAGISYETSVRRRLGLFASYRLRALGLSEPQSLRTMSNSLTLGIVARFGRGTP